MWNIRKTVSKGEYIYAVVPEHPRAIDHGYVLEHRVIMENYLGRLLEDGEIVHHKDRNKKNNSVENPEVMLMSEHTRMHVKVGQTLIHTKCPECCKHFSRRKGRSAVFCSRSCNGKYQRRKQIYQASLDLKPQKLESN